MNLNRYNFMKTKMFKKKWGYFKLGTSSLQNLFIIKKIQNVFYNKYF